MKLPESTACLHPKGWPWTGGSFVNNSAGRRAAEETMKAENETRGYKPRRHYDDNYKQHAVDLTLRGTRSVRQVADELGINVTMLYEWRRTYAPHPGAPVGTPQSIEDATKEIERLRAELVRMQERENVLKKSLGILSETPGSGMPRSRQ